MAKMILKSWYIAWEGRQEKGIRKTLEKKSRELVTEKRTLCSWLELIRLRQGQSLYLIFSTVLPNRLWAFFLFYNQASSFSQALQIYCLGLLGRNPILFRIQFKTGPYNIYIYIYGENALLVSTFWVNFHFGPKIDFITNVVHKKRKLILF